MKKIALFIRFIFLQFATCLSLEVFRTTSSNAIPVLVTIQDVTSDYCVVDPTLYYYEITAVNSSLDYKAVLTATLTYQKADSKNYTRDFWRSLYLCEGAIASATILATAYISLSTNIEPAKISIPTYFGSLAALCCLGIQSLRHNKTADLYSSMHIPKAHIALHTNPSTIYNYDDSFQMILHGSTTYEKVNGVNSIVFSTKHPLKRILINIDQEPTYYHIVLSEY